MKMLHVTIRTAFFDKELQFYQEIVGLGIQRDMRSMGRNMIFLADEKGDTEIEIIETPGSVNSGNDNLSIGFQTEDVFAKQNELMSMGMETSPMVNPAPGVSFFFVKDPAGVSVQFM